MSRDRYERRHRFTNAARREANLEPAPNAPNETLAEAMGLPTSPGERADRHVAILTGPNCHEKSQLIGEWMKFGEPQDREITTAMVVRRLAERVEALEAAARALAATQEPR